MLLRIKAVDFVAELVESATPQRSSPEYRREETRIDVCAHVDIEVMRTTGVVLQSMRGRILNVASHSLTVVCRQRIVAGSRIRVILASGRFCESDVVHCTQTIGGHKIGLKLD